MEIFAVKLLSKAQKNEDNKTNKTPLFKFNSIRLKLKFNNITPIKIQKKPIKNLKSLLSPRKIIAIVMVNIISKFANRDTADADIYLSAKIIKTGPKNPPNIILPIRYGISFLLRFGSKFFLKVFKTNKKTKEDKYNIEDSSKAGILLNKILLIGMDKANKKAEINEYIVIYILKKVLKSYPVLWLCKRL